jgi:hypothetical protein
VLALKNAEDGSKDKQGGGFISCRVPNITGIRIKAIAMTK